MTEIFKTIEGFEASYQISNIGRVKSLERKVKNRWGLWVRKEKIMSPSKANRYWTINLCSNSKLHIFKIHRLVATAFIPNPESKPQVNHKDGNKLNNCVDNLEWVTQCENMQHAKGAGLRPNFKGDKNPCAKLTDIKVREIKNKYKEGSTTYRELGEEYGVSHAVVFNILKGKIWSHIKTA